MLSNNEELISHICTFGSELNYPEVKVHDFLPEPRLQASSSSLPRIIKKNNGKWAPTFSATISVIVYVDKH